MGYILLGLVYKWKKSLSKLYQNVEWLLLENRNTVLTHILLYKKGSMDSDTNRNVLHVTTILAVSTKKFEELIFSYNWFNIYQSNFNIFYFNFFCWSHYTINKDIHYFTNYTCKKISLKLLCIHLEFYRETIGKILQPVLFLHLGLAPGAYRSFSIW